MYIANPIYDVVFKFMMEDGILTELQEKEREIENREKIITEQEKPLKKKINSLKKKTG